MTTSICFSSSGWAVTYYLGIAAYIQDYYNIDNTVFLSCSGGILPSLLLCLNINIRDTFHKLKPIAELCNCGYLTPSQYSVQIIDLLLDIFPNNLCELIENRIKLSVTRIPSFTNEIIDQFNDIDELKNAIICSCYSPLFFPNLLPKYRDSYYIDGGFSNNHPIIDNNTIIISAFFNRDINPLNKLPIISRVYYPGNEEKLNEIFNLGYKNAIEKNNVFIEKNLIVKELHCVNTNLNIIDDDKYQYVFINNIDDSDKN